MRAWRKSRSLGHVLSDVPNPRKRNQLARLPHLHVHLGRNEAQSSPQPTQPFGRCRYDAHFDLSEGNECSCFFLACCGLCPFERGEPLLKQIGDHLVLHVFVFPVRLLIIPSRAERSTHPRAIDARR